tara:strand:+ start:15650 stop:16447 length:798 start_codon:yes stop_codon:yes gene_type:complete
MKKKVLFQINTLAKSIIASENDIDIIKTKNTLIQLYEKLTVLEFLKSSVTTEFEKPERPATDSKTYREENWFQDPDPVPQPSHKDALVEPLMEKIKDLVAQMPSESDPDGSAIEDLLKEILPKKETYKNDLEEFAASYQENPIFERKQEVKKEEKVSVSVKEKEKENDFDLESETESSQNKPKSINDKLNQGLNIGLNDRIAFIKHLFESNTDDYTRVLSQINSMTTYQEAHSFVENNIKPDYNNWEDKEEYADRFLLIIEKRFN